MVFKLKTSKETMEIFSEIGSSTNLQPFALAKVAIALSISSNKQLEDNDFNTNNEGLELNRQTITGDHDTLFRSLIINELKKPLTEEEYFPKYLKAHLDRGAKLLLNEFKYSRNFIDHLCKIDEGI